MNNVRLETKYIVIHSSNTNPKQNFDVKDIDRQHRKDGYFSCAFHKVITRSGEVQDGRDIQIAGAHVDSSVKLSNKKRSHQNDRYVMQKKTWSRVSAR